MRRSADAAAIPRVRRPFARVVAGRVPVPVRRVRRTRRGLAWNIARRGRRGGFGRGCGRRGKLPRCARRHGLRSHDRFRWCDTWRWRDRGRGLCFDLGRRSGFHRCRGRDRHHAWFSLGWRSDLAFDRGWHHAFYRRRRKLVLWLRFHWRWWRSIEDFRLCGRCGLALDGRWRSRDIWLVDHLRRVEIQARQRLRSRWRHWWGCGRGRRFLRCRGHAVAHARFRRRLRRKDIGWTHRVASKRWCNASRARQQCGSGRYGIGSGCESEAWSRLTGQCAQGDVEHIAEVAVAPCSAIGCGAEQHDDPQVQQHRQHDALNQRASVEHRPRSRAMQLSIHVGVRA